MPKKRNNSNGKGSGNGRGGKKPKGNGDSRQGKQSNENENKQRSNENDEQNQQRRSRSRSRNLSARSNRARSNSIEYDRFRDGSNESRSEGNVNNNVVDATYDDGIDEVMVQVRLTDRDEAEFEEPSQEIRQDEEISFPSRNNNANVMSMQRSRSSTETADTIPIVTTSRAGEKEDWINEAVNRFTGKMMDIMKQGGMLPQQQASGGHGDPGDDDPKKGKQQPKRKDEGRRKSDGKTSSDEDLDSNSEITIYKRAVQLGNERVGEVIETGDKTVNKRGSSSSEELVDTSDELIDLNTMMTQQNIVDRRDSREGDSRRNNSYVDDGQVAHCSRYEQPQRQQERKQPGEARAEEMICQAEATKAKMYDVPGKSQEYLINAIADEGYSVVAAHLDDATKQRIENDEFVDFAKLIPKDRVIAMADSNLMEMLVNKEGRTFWSPISDRDKTAINSYQKWEVAFRIFSNVYTAKYPQRAVKLTQYHHIIYTAAQTYVWEQVYAYDVDFRIHIANYPERKWSTILQLAWNVRLRDRINNSYGSNRQSTGSNGGHDRNKTRRELCWKYNQGRCTYGSSCRFEHRCSLCLKFGHGSHICRRAGKIGNGNNFHNGSNGGDRRDSYERETGERIEYRRDRSDGRNTNNNNNSNNNTNNKRK